MNISRKLKPFFCKLMNGVQQFLAILGIHVGGPVHILEESRYFLRYLSFAGSLPLDHVFRINKKISFSWTSIKVSYCIGAMIFLACYGFIRIDSKYLYIQVFFVCWILNIKIMIYLFIYLFI